MSNGDWDENQKLKHRADKSRKIGGEKAQRLLNIKKTIEALMAEAKILGGK
jgi:tRNA 2-selenouridine synthase SelU